MLKLYYKKVIYIINKLFKIHIIYKIKSEIQRLYKKLYLIIIKRNHINKKNILIYFLLYDK